MWDAGGPSYLPHPPNHLSASGGAMALPGGGGMERYLILGRVGEGAHGVVFKANDREVRGMGEWGGWGEEGG